MYNEYELLTHLRRINGDSPPTEPLINQDEKAPSARTYRNRYGSLEAAYKETGYSEDEIRYDITREELIDALQKHAIKWYAPAREKIKRLDMPDGKTYDSRFDGGLEGAIQEAGLVQWKNRGKKDEIKNRF